MPLNTKNPLAIRRNVDALAAVIREQNIDIVHARSRAPAWSAKAAAEQTGVKAVRNYGEAFRSRAVVTMATLYFFWGLALFGFVLWLPTIIKQAGAVAN